MTVPFETEAPSRPLIRGRLGSLRAVLLRRARPWMAGLLAAADLLALASAGLLAMGLRGVLAQADRGIYLHLAILPFLFMGIYALWQLYPAIGMGPVEEFRRLILATGFGFIVIAAASFVTRTPPVYSRLVFFLAWVTAMALVPLGRLVTRAVFARLGLWGEPVALVGPWDAVRDIATILKRRPWIGLIPALVCRQGACPAIRGRAAWDLPGHGRSPACQSCLVSLARTVLVVYTDAREVGAIREEYRDSYERVILVNQADHGLKLSGISVREFGGLTGLEIRQNLANRWAQVQKRAIDLAGAVVGLALISPLFLLIAALIYLDDHGRIFYHQVRVGKDGRYFRMIKFRTMHLNADQVLQACLEKDPALKREWDAYQKLTVDPRLTRVGRILRRFSLDELPQLINVLAGDMSIVGPRPIMVNQSELYGEAYRHYVRVLPGITGLWQVSGRNRTTFVERARFDIEYVNTWSVWFDLYILARTAWVVLSHDGAH